MRIKFFFNLLLIPISIFFTLLVLEILIRNFINFDKDYYIQKKNEKDKSMIIYPYGNIPINKDGYFDEEFNFDNNKIKIGYFGDSVTYGVGAGYPYRFTEYLDQIDPKYDHLNLSGGLGISLFDWKKSYEDFLISKKIDRVIYVMNLNDIAPLSELYEKKSSLNKKETNKLNSLIYFFRPVDRKLRGNSALYTYVRLKIKNFLMKINYSDTGFKFIELFPDENERIIENASKAINLWAENLRKKNISACVVILPYEMQISNDAKNYYRSIGIKFDKSFEDFKTQEILKNYISQNTSFFILKEGFLEKEIGYYFVFNKGDKIDFNHPNRNGHLVIANEISKNKICQI